MPGPKVLGQHAGTGALANVYTAPAGGGVIVSTIVLVGASATGTAEVRIAPGGAADTAVHIFLPATPVVQGDHVALTEGITLAPGDVVRVNASAGVNVHAYGMEL